MRSEVQQPAPTQLPKPVSTFTVLGQPNFRWLFLSDILANSATWVQGVTMGWLVYEMTGIAIGLALLTGIQRVWPLLVLCL